MNKFDSLTRQELRDAWEATYKAYNITNDERLTPLLDELFDAYFVKSKY
jgi:hypothetical protein